MVFPQDQPDCTQPARKNNKNINKTRKTCRRHHPKIAFGSHPDRHVKPLALARTKIVQHVQSAKEEPGTTSELNPCAGGAARAPPAVATTSPRVAVCVTTCGPTPVVLHGRGRPWSRRWGWWRSVDAQRPFWPHRARVLVAGTGPGRNLDRKTPRKWSGPHPGSA